MTVSAQDNDLMAVLDNPGCHDHEKTVAWAKLLEQHYCDLCLIAGRLLRRVWGEQSTAHAEDVVQETFAVLLVKRHCYDPKRPFRPWAFRVVRNVALGMWRRERLQQRRPLAADLAGRERTPLEQLISRELLEGMTPEERALFQGLIDHGLADVGRILDPENDNLFTWWAPWRNLRQRNIGWRIDYVLASESLAKTATRATSMREFGTSDHAPLAVTFGTS